MSMRGQLIPQNVAALEEKTVGYTLITKRREIGVAFQELRNRITEGVRPLHRRLSYPGAGQQTHRVYWRPKDGFWAVLEISDSYYWCLYGHEDPTRLSPRQPLLITCQINPPLEGMPGRCGGAFALDEKGNLTYAHTGKVGGHRPGIGKTNFLAFRGIDDLVDLVSADRKLRAIVVGKLGTRGFLHDLAGYLRVVAAFRARPTTDSHALDETVDGILSKGKIPRPKGQRRPHKRRVSGSGVVFARDPEVKAWVLQTAQGRCEQCGRQGPFKKTRTGRRYLEVHHVVQLADDGPDTPENAVAVCPNCHRHLHLGLDAEARRLALCRAVRRLASPCRRGTLSRD
jgi:5-methylcytosine-specific restriction endonuclease McrA